MAMAMAISSSWPVLVVYQSATMHKLRESKPVFVVADKGVSQFSDEITVSEDVLWSFADHRACLRFSRAVQEDWVRT
jgi:hypothetical protein